MFNVRTSYLIEHWKEENRAFVKIYKRSFYSLKTIWNGDGCANKNELLKQFKTSY
jgi:hypothetical protein